jgi:hypothetical protein
MNLDPDLRDSILFEVHSALSLASSLIHRSVVGRNLDDPNYIRLLVVGAQTRGAAEAVSGIIDENNKRAVAGNLHKEEEIPF